MSDTKKAMMEHFEKCAVKLMYWYDKGAISEDGLHQCLEGVADDILEFFGMEN